MVQEGKSGVRQHSINPKEDKKREKKPILWDKERAPKTGRQELKYISNDNKCKST